MSIWLLGSDKGAVISYMMALSQKKSDVPLSEHPYVIFVYMFTGSLVNNRFMARGICSNVMVYNFCSTLARGAEF